LELDASWIGAHATAEADGSNVNWTIDGSLVFHIRTPHSKDDFLIFGK
jgi:hypothetical protein